MIDYIQSLTIEINMKFNKLFSIIALGAMAAGLAACSDSEPQRMQGDAPNKDGVFFSLDDSDVIQLENQQSSFTINLYREKTDEALTVSLSSEATGEPCPFVIPSLVQFEKGESVVPIEIGVLFSDVVAEQKYSIALSVGDEEGTPYGLSSRLFTVSYEPYTPWEYIGDGTYTYTCLWTLEDPEVPVYCRQSAIDPNRYQYRLGNVGDASVPESSQYGMAYGVNYLIEYNKATKAVTFPPVGTAYIHSESGTSFGEVFCASVYDYCKDINPAFAGNTPLDQLLTLNSFDEKTGLFTVNMRYYIGSQPTLGFTNGEEYLQLPGYTDYTVSVNTNGHHVADNGDETQVLSIYMSENIASVKYGVFAGSLTEAQAETQAKALVEDPDAGVLTATGNIAVALEPGTYTAVIAGLDDKENYQSFDYITFEFVSVKSDPNAGWTSLGEVLYTEDIMASVFQYPEVVSYMVELQLNDDDPGLIRLVNPYGEAWPYGEVYGCGANYLNVNITDADGVYIERSPMNLDLGDGALEISSYGYELMLNGKSLAFVKANGYCGTMAGGKITMPAAKKGPILWVGDAGFYYGNSNGAFCIDLTGGGEEEETAAVKSFAAEKLSRVQADLIVAQKQRMTKKFKATVLSADEFAKTRKLEGETTVNGVK